MRKNKKSNFPSTRFELKTAILCSDFPCCAKNDGISENKNENIR